MSEPADIINRALDQIGRSDIIIGDPEEGTEASKVALRAYSPALSQLLRAAHWTFARKVAPLTMLADATGQTPDVGTTVIAPWVYEYSLPEDCLQARFVPANYLNPNSVPSGNRALPTTPQTTVSQPPYGCGMRLTPAPFLISSDFNYPVDSASNWQETQGTSPTSRTVVLTNVNQANMVYTALMIYPSTWDSLFEQAMVDLLAARLALPLAKDQKFGLQVRELAVKSLKESVMQARVASSNESAYPQTTDNLPDFMRIRNSGGGAYGNNGLNGCGFNGPGVLGYGWGSLSLGNGSVF